MLLRLVRQRTEADCTVAVLASWLHIPYEEALVAISAHAPTVLHTGSYLSTIIAAAREFGVEFYRAASYDLDEDCGILSVSGRRVGGDHVVILWDGKIYDTDAAVWDVHEYLQMKRAKRGVLLMEA